MEIEITTMTFDDSVPFDPAAVGIEDSDETMNGKGEDK